MKYTGLYWGGESHLIIQLLVWIKQHFTCCWMCLALSDLDQ